MASITNHYYYNGAWNNGGSLESGYAGLGPHDGKTKIRSVFKITLNSIQATQRRSTLTIKMSVASAGPSSNFSDSIYYNLTNSSYGSGSSIQGSSYDSGSGPSFTSRSVSVIGIMTLPDIVIDTSSVPSSTNTVYLWMYANCSTSGSYASYTIQSISASEGAAVTVTTPVTTGSITTSSGQFYKPNDTVTVNWNAGSNGTNNTVSGYTAYLRFGSAPSTGSYDKRTTGLGTSVRSTTFDISEATRGTSVYVGVVATGTNGNGSIQTKKVGTINYQPAAPTYSASGTSINTSTKITYTVTAGTDSDTSQTKTLYYSLNSGAKVLFTSPLTISTSTTGVTSGSNNIVFYTYDGKEYSTASTKHTFTATFAPVIGQATFTHTDIQDMSNSTSSKLASAAKIEFTMSSGTPETVKLYVRTADSESALSGNGTEVLSSLYSYNLELDVKTITISSIIAISSIGNGKYYQFAFKVLDSNKTESEVKGWSAARRKPLPPRLPTYTRHSTHTDSSYGAVANANYYKDNVTIYYSNPAAANGYAKISSVKIEAFFNNTSEEFTCPTTSGSTQATLNLSRANGNDSTTFKFKITDEAGQVQTSDINVSTGTKLTLIKSTALTFGGSIADVSNENLKPMTNTQDFKISHPVAQASGTQNIVYKYRISVVGHKEAYLDSTYEPATTSDIAIVTISAADINALAKSLVPNYNDVFDVIIYITAADGFGTVITLNTELKMKFNFTEPPVFTATNPVFRIRHDYYIDSNEAGPNVGFEVPAYNPNTWLSDRNIIMVNSGEGIIFALPKATDPNDDISEYVIHLSRNDFIDFNKILDYNEVSYIEWLSIPYDTVLKNDKYDDNFYYYRYKASQYTKNEYFYFKVQVRDKTGNVSKEVPCHNFILGCRTAAPTFSAGDVKAERNGTTVTLKYRFMITDLGGSATKDGWSKSFYNNFPNFERTINGYAPQAILNIDIAPDQSFTTDVVSSGPIYFNPSGSQGLLDFTNTSTELRGFSEAHAKIFMRFTLTVSYGLKNSTTRATINSLPQVYTYFGSVPTVAHRTHRVGINTNSLGPDDVLVVENYQGTKYVVFKGTDASNAANSYEIRINLLEGKIYGVKKQGDVSTPYFQIDSATIDGGEW